MGVVTKIRMRTETRESKPTCEGIASPNQPRQAVRDIQISQHSKFLDEPDSIATCAVLQRRHIQKAVRHVFERAKEKEWSGREDLNLRPPGPEL